MTSFASYKTARRALSARLCALAWGPFIATIACNVYDNSMVGGVAAPLGGSDAEGGSGATSGSVASAGGGAAAAAGTESVGGVSGTGGISPDGGKAGDMADKGGSAGVEATAGSAGKGGSAGGGSGGGGGSAGTGGSAGSTAGSGGSATQDSDPIDDMEDDDAQIELIGGRDGFWYVGSDGTVGATTVPMGSFSMLALAQGDHGTSKYSAHLKATGFTGWGSVVGFNMIEQLGTVKPYDASAYCGVQFWGKAAVATTVRFRLPDGDTHQAGGVCNGSASPPANAACYDHFGAYAQLTTAWKAFPVKFSDLAQLGTGYHPTDGKLKADKLYAIEWALPGGGATTYEIWIDDVEFLKCK